MNQARNADFEKFVEVRIGVHRNDCVEQRNVVVFGEFEHATIEFDCDNWRSIYSSGWQVRVGAFMARAFSGSSPAGQLIMARLR